MLTLGSSSYLEVDKDGSIDISDAIEGKPIIISTGITTFDEIQDAVAICRGEGNNDIVLLKCTSAYPA